MKRSVIARSERLFVTIDEEAEDVGKEMEVDEFDEVGEVGEEVDDEIEEESDVLEKMGDCEGEGSGGEDDDIETEVDEVFFSHCCFSLSLSLFRFICPTYKWLIVT